MNPRSDLATEITEDNSRVDRSTCTKTCERQVIPQRRFALELLSGMPEPFSRHFNQAQRSLCG